ncbi:hypothetical protein HPB48_018964 [Haemaphysalis longicornis]|uniref:Uncharacterized protein n=1 Tax=Haemaphysalis longicornis TaxID=44386 RepID=A0A9J6GMB8_HAELO|nr:hypothetical protein HPB48_018964 [Haemaphysalis longicornis]
MSQIKCHESFAMKCLRGVAQGVILFTTGAAFDEYHSVCNSSSRKHKVYLNSVKCINKAGPSMQSCIKAMFVDLHRASETPAHQQIPYSCCYYQEFLECGEKALTENCDHPAAKEFFNDIIDHVLGESLNVVCINMFKKGTGTCETLPTLSTVNDDEAGEKGFIESLPKIAENIG